MPRLDLTFRTRILGLSVVTLGLFLFILASYSISLSSARNAFTSFIDQDLAELQALEEMYAQGLQSGQATRNVALDPANPKAYKNLKKSLQGFDEALQTARKLGERNPSMLNLTQDLAEMSSRRNQVIDKVLALTATDFNRAAKTINEEETPLWREIRQKLLDAIKLKRQSAQKARQDTDDRIKHREIMMIWLAVIGGLVAAFALSRIVRNLFRLLGGEPEEVVNRVRRIGRGDLTAGTITDCAKESIMDVVQEMQKELTGLIDKVKTAQEQLLQSEKMSSIGQLAAGVAHEINNPVGFVHSNMGTLEKYIQNLLKLLDAYERAESTQTDPLQLEEIAAIKQQIDVQYLRQDIDDLIKESKDGLNRVKKIVQDLKTFSHVDGADWQAADIQEGLESTLNMAWNEIKYKAEVIKNYAPLPPVKCLPSQLNQVFMNLLLNAAQAITERGTITLSVGAEGGWVWVSVADTGVGIPAENLARVFEPFFTTKPVGKGTGLGMSLSYGIVSRHGGRIEVESELGKGTCFKVWIPIEPEAMESAVEFAENR